MNKKMAEYHWSEASVQGRSMCSARGLAAYVYKRDLQSFGSLSHSNFLPRDTSTTTQCSCAHKPGFLGKEILLLLSF
jgi:hypothetical protein